jgi:hypothetical protein
METANERYAEHKQEQNLMYSIGVVLKFKTTSVLLYTDLNFFFNVMMLSVARLYSME